MAIRGRQAKATFTRLVLDTLPIYALVTVAYATAADIELNQFTRIYEFRKSARMALRVFTPIRQTATA